MYSYCHNRDVLLAIEETIATIVHKMQLFCLSLIHIKFGNFLSSRQTVKFRQRLMFVVPQTRIFRRPIEIRSVSECMIIYLLLNRPTPGHGIFTLRYWCALQIAIRYNCGTPWNFDQLFSVFRCSIILFNRWDI